jgi:hypothetical protein
MFSYVFHTVLKMTQIVILPGAPVNSETKNF